MKDIKSILVPTDLTDNSRRGLLYSCALAAQNQATLTILHIANDLAAWEYLCDDSAFLYSPGKTWPADRIIAEAHLELNRFIEPHLMTLRRVPRVTKRIVLGRIAEEIADAAETEHADLVIMSRRRRRKLYHWVSGSITDRVTRLCPCPVLSVTEPLPSGRWRGGFAANFFRWPRPALGL